MRSSQLSGLGIFSLSTAAAALETCLIQPCSSTNLDGSRTRHTEIKHWHHNMATLLSVPLLRLGPFLLGPLLLRLRAPSLRWTKPNDLLIYDHHAASQYSRHSVSSLPKYPKYSNTPNTTAVSESTLVHWLTCPLYRQPLSYSE